jgi:hypothetical protein
MHDRDPLGHHAIYGSARLIRRGGAIEAHMLRDRDGEARLGAIPFRLGWVLSKGR